MVFLWKIIIAPSFLTFLDKNLYWRFQLFAGLRPSKELCLWWAWTSTQKTLSHFIRHSLLALGWAPFYLHSCSKSSCHTFNIWSMITWHHHTAAADLPAVSTMRISSFTTSQRCSTGLRSEPSGVTIMLKKPVWGDLQFVTWSVTLPEAAIGRWATVVVLRRCTRSANSAQLALGF